MTNKALEHPKQHEALNSFLGKVVPQTVPGRIIDPAGWLKSWNGGGKVKKQPFVGPPKPKGLVGRPMLVEPIDERKKICTKCKEFKPMSDFQRDSTTRDGRKYRCRECIYIKKLMRGAA